MAKERVGGGKEVADGGEEGKGGGEGAVGWLPLKDFIPSLSRPRHPYIRVSNLRATPPFLFSFLLFLTLLLPLRARDRSLLTLYVHEYMEHGRALAEKHRLTLYIRVRIEGRV